MTTRAETERSNRAWYDDHHGKIAKRAGLTLLEFRLKSETTQMEIMRDPERYQIESKEQ